MALFGSSNLRGEVKVVGQIEAIIQLLIRQVNASWTSVSAAISTTDSLFLTKSFLLFRVLFDVPLSPLSECWPQEVSKG